MRESRTWLIILHFTPVFFTNVLVTIYTRPSAVLNVIYPEGILHVVISLILILTQALKILPRSCLLPINIKILNYIYIYSRFTLIIMRDTNRQNINFAKLGIYGRSLRESCCGNMIRIFCCAELIVAYIFNVMCVHFVREKVAQVFLSSLTCEYV